MTLKPSRGLISVSVGATLLVACRQDMHDQPKYKPLAVSTFFADGRSARPIPAGTIARSELNDMDSAHTGAVGNGFLDSLPMPVTESLLRRGQERYDIFCSPCHDRMGTGHGMIAQRGFKIPADLNSDRVRNSPPGYLFEVISNGYQAMPDYKDQIPVQDRWAIVAYLRALELSRNSKMEDVPPQLRARLGAEQ